MLWRRAARSVCRVSGVSLRGRGFGRWGGIWRGKGERGVFVSSHFRVAADEVSGFLRRHGLAFRDGGEHCVVRECPLCGKPTYGRADNLFKLYIRKDSGVFFCHRCGSKGSWMDLRARIGEGARGVAMGGAEDGKRGRGRGGGGGGGGASGGRGGKGVEEGVKGAKGVRGGGAAGSGTASELPFHLPTAQAALVSGDKFPGLLEWLVAERGLERETLETFGVAAVRHGFWDDHARGFREMESVAFPMRGADGPVHRVKVRSRVDKSKQALLPKGATSWGLFGVLEGVEGWEVGLEGVGKAVVVTEGEFDAMAVFQATHLPCVSLPNGCRSLPPEVLPLLEPFDKILLWLDDDGPGREAVERIAGKLGAGRCLVVRSAAAKKRGKRGRMGEWGGGKEGGGVEKEKEGGGVEKAEEGVGVVGGVVGGLGGGGVGDEDLDWKDANDVLRFGGREGVLCALREAAPIPHKEVLRFSDLREAVMADVANPSVLAGTPFRSLPPLQSLLKGHRSGEMTVLTGPTGAGKTTLLSQLSLDLAAQGIPTLWGSFEIKNATLIRRMLSQCYGGLSPGEEMEAAAEAFEQLPLFFLRFYGATDVDAVLDAMEYSTYAHDVAHVVLDNLQFMTAGKGSRADRWETQEYALDQFRQFATLRNVHVSVVIHPRKEPQGAMLSLSSVFGTAKATQEADNVVIMQREDEAHTGKKRVDVRKNRFDGQVGSFPVDFDRTANLFVPKGAVTAATADGGATPIALLHKHTTSKPKRRKTNTNLQTTSSPSRTSTTSTSTTTSSSSSPRHSSKPYTTTDPRRTPRRRPALQQTSQLRTSTTTTTRRAPRVQPQSPPAPTPSSPSPPPLSPPPSTPAPTTPQTAPATEWPEDDILTE